GLPVTADSPGCVWFMFNRPLRETEGFGHLAQDNVCQDHGRVPVSVCKFKGFHCQVTHLLYTVWGQDYVPVVPVSPALHQLVVVSLFRADVTETWTCTHHINYHCRKLRACKE